MSESKASLKHPHLKERLFRETKAKQKCQVTKKLAPWSSQWAQTIDCNTASDGRELQRLCPRYSWTQSVNGKGRVKLELLNLKSVDDWLTGCYQPRIRVLHTKPLEWFWSLVWLYTHKFWCIEVFYNFTIFREHSRQQWSKNGRVELHYWTTGAASRLPSRLSV